MNRSPWRLEEVDGSPWRLEEVDGGDEQYPVESRFVVRHTPANQQDPVPNIGGPFPPLWGTPGLVSVACSVQALLMNTTTHSIPTQPVGSHAFRCLPMNTTHSVASP